MSMDFSPSPRDSSATLTAVETRRTTPPHSHVPDIEHADFQSTEGFRTPTKDLQHTPTTPYYSDFGASKSGYSGDRLSEVGSSLTTGIARDSTYLLPTTDRKKNRFVRVPYVSPRTEYKDYSVDSTGLALAYSSRRAAFYGSVGDCTGSGDSSFEKA